VSKKSGPLLSTETPQYTLAQPNSAVQPTTPNVADAPARELQFECIKS